MADIRESYSDGRGTCSPTSSASSSSFQPNSGTSCHHRHGHPRIFFYNIPDGQRKTGKCKWFNVVKGWGFITPDDGSQEVFVHQSVIQMGGFRSLGDDEPVEFEFRECEKGYEATLVTGVQGLQCAGSHRRPAKKKKVKKIRCYNCGDLANHVASKCNLGPQPKRCHSCKSEGHLIADCPVKATKVQETKIKDSNSTDDGIDISDRSSNDFNS